MKVNWTDEALTSYETTINNSLKKWPIDIVIDLENNVNRLIKRLEENKHLCPASKKDFNLRKCVISAQTSLVYEVDNNNIDLLFFFDNRSEVVY